MQESERLTSNQDGVLPIAVHSNDQDAKAMEQIYQKYNPELLANADPSKGPPQILEENLELVSAVNNLNAMSH